MEGFGKLKIDNFIFYGEFIKNRKNGYFEIFKDNCLYIKGFF